MVCSTEYYYAIFLYKEKALLKIVPIAAMAVSCTMDIWADEYTAQWTAKAFAVTTPPQ